MNNLEKSQNEILPKLQIIPEEKPTPTPIEVINGALINLENEEKSTPTPTEEHHTLQ